MWGKTRDANETKPEEAAASAVARAEQTPSSGNGVIELLPVRNVDARPATLSAGQTGALNWLSILQLKRNGSDNSDLASFQLNLVAGQRYKLTSAIGAIVGKLQFVYGDKAIKTVDAPGFHDAIFAGMGEQQNLVLRCVARTDASVVLSELAIEPI